MPRLPQKYKALVLRLHRAQVSHIHIADQVSAKLGRVVSRQTVSRWCKAEDDRVAGERLRADADAAELEEQDEPAAPPSEPVDEPLPDVPADAGLDLYEHVREQMRVSMSIAAAASRDSNHRAAQQAQRDVLEFSKTLARLDATRKQGADGVFIPQAEWEAAQLEMTARVEALAYDLSRTGGIVCSSCGREIRVKLASGG